MRNTILAIALSVFAASASAWNEGSTVAGQNSASAWAGTSSASRVSGNGIAGSSGSAMRHSTSSLDLHRSPNLVGATGAASTWGVTTHHSFANGNASTSGHAHSQGSADFGARGAFTDRVRAYDGTTGTAMGNMVINGRVTGESSTSSGAVYRGQSGGYAVDDATTTGRAVADFDFNRYTGADSKRAEVDTTQSTFAEAGSYRSGYAGANTGASSTARVGGDANVNAYLSNRGCTYRCPTPRPSRTPSGNNGFGNGPDGLTPGEARNGGGARAGQDD